MEISAILHRPESEYAYLYKKDLMHIRLRTKRDDVKEVGFIGGDPYSGYTEKWYLKEKSMKKVATTEYHDYWMVEVTASYNRLSYGFHVVGQDESEVFYGDRGAVPFNEENLKGNLYFRMPYFQEMDRFKAPEWVKKTVWYQIFPERFANGNPENDPEGTLPWDSNAHPGRADFYGGDLQGVIDQLDYLEDLGINGIYFCPIFKAKSNHKYDTVDYFEIDPAFGDKETFKKLVEEAHRRGIRIMLDAVFNHIGVESPQWQDVLKNQENSKYKDWFHIKQFPVEDISKLSVEELENVGQLSYETFAFTGHMPKLNTANKEVQEYLLEIATYWIKEFDIDAWRLDVANEVDHHFWKRFNKEVTSIKPDIYILGEIWHSSQNWLAGDEFHAVMNYAFTESISDYFVKKNITAPQMAARLNEQLMLYRMQTNEVMFNMLDSHDTTRLLTLCEGNKDLAKTTLAFMFMQHGSPCIYYGTEVGMDGENDPDCRKCMIWNQEDQDLEMLDFTKKLISFRKDFQELLSYGNLIWEEVASDHSLVKFSRQLSDEKVIGYFNQGNQEITIQVLEKSALACSNKAQISSQELSIQPNGFAIVIS